MKSDKQLRADVQDELTFEPSIDAANVGVAVQDGVVTLSGHLNTYAEKATIERVVSRVNGVAAVALELDVKLSPDHVRSDTEIAQAVESALNWNALLPRDRIKVKVEKAWVTLSGELDWDYQRQLANKAVRALTGLRGLTDLLTLKSHTTPQDVTTRISDALARRARSEAGAISVKVVGSTITLRGQVDTQADRIAAVGAAWSAPGITAVINELTIKV